MSTDLKTIIETGIIETAKNHPEYIMGSNVYFALKRYQKHIKDHNVPIAIEEFGTGFSRYDKAGNPIREKMMELVTKENIDPALETLDLLFRYTHDKYVSMYNGTNQDTILTSLVKFYDAYYRLNSGRPINEIREDIYRSPDLLNSVINDDLRQIIIEYSAKLEQNESTIRFTQITETASHLMSNIKNDRLVSEFNAVSKDGRVQISSIQGRHAPQEDAVLSIRKGGCMLNVVADGMGGTEKGAEASKMCILELAKWFRDLNLSKYAMEFEPDENLVNNSNSLFDEISDKLKDIDKDIFKAHDGAGGTTVVLAFTTPSYTLFVNVGDSTAYVTDFDEVYPMSTIDPVFPITEDITRDYEAFRNHPNNNYVGQCLGLGMSRINPYHHLLIHKGHKKILLSSDGVTDLVNEENFKRMIKNNYSAQQITEKAFVDPDDHVPNPKYYGVSHKSSDNISAIIIDIPEEVKKGRKR